MGCHDTYLAPGQRYVRADLAAWRADQHITIVHVGRDTDQVLRVTCRCPSGQEVRAVATQLEIAIAAGEIVPVMGAGHLGHC
jgi:hypothetical protein